MRALRRLLGLSAVTLVVACGSKPDESKPVSVSAAASSKPKPSGAAATTKPDSAPSAPATTTATASAAASASGAPESDAAPGAAMNLKIEEGWIGEDRWVPEFTFRRDPGTEGLTFADAEARCQQRSLDVCTSTQFERACEVDAHAGEVELWTATADAAKLVSRGGAGGCATKATVDPYQTEPKRSFACCSRSIGIHVDKPDLTFLKMTHQHMMDFEGGLRADTPPLAKLLAPKVSFLGKTIGSDELVVKNEAARGSAYWLIHDACKVAPGAADTWTAECTKIWKAQKGVATGTTRYEWLGKESAVKTITDL